MSYYNSFKRIANNFLFITGIPSLASFFAPQFGYNGLTTFFVTLLGVWVLSIELRLKDLKNNGRKK